MQATLHLTESLPSSLPQRKATVAKKETVGKSNDNGIEHLIRNNPTVIL